ncbi:MAG: S41 family peptidase [Chloroflexi bacterium]|nr:S41 family peptidase [Chloroflexota bacterium]
MNPAPSFLGRMRGIPAAAALVIVFFTGYAVGTHQSISFAQGDRATPEEVESAFAPFWEVFNHIQDQYIEEVSLDTLVAGASDGMVDALEDPFSGYMDSETLNLMNSDLEGEFEGIGVVIHTIEDSGEIEVVGILNGAPAQGSGIEPGDIFAFVDGIDVSEMNQADLAAIVRGPQGTEVTITMRRERELLDFVLTRERIVVPNVESRLLEEENIAYVRLNNFNDRSRAEIDDALDDLRVNRRAGLIFDLRDNPGGLLSSSIEVASAFIESGPIVTEVFGDGSEQEFTANGSFANVRVPIVVLVNESSASASELVAGAMQDTGVATIIGEVTLGKGTVQQWYTLQNNTGLRLTVAQWLTPNRRWIHEEGITPDIVVEWTPEIFNDPNDPQIAEAVNWLLLQTGERVKLD